MFYLLLLVHLAVASDHIDNIFDVAYSWKQLEFKFPNDSIRNELIASGEYIPGNNMPVGLAIWRKRMFITVPRWKKGVLATLNSFSMESNTRE